MFWLSLLSENIGQPMVIKEWVFYYCSLIVLYWYIFFLAADTAGINVKVNEEEEEERVDLKVMPPEEMEGKVVVEVLTGPTDIDVAVKEEKGHVNIKVDQKEGGEVGREVVVQGNEVEGKLEVLILAGSSLEDEEG